MDSPFRFLFGPTTGPASIALIRLAVKLTFFTQGILKYIDPDTGVVGFSKIGFPHPYFAAHFVGTFEIVGGFLIVIGFWTRASAVPLLLVISTAIVTTKIPEPSRGNQGFWYMVSDALTDLAMLCSLLFLILVGSGAWSLEARRCW
jgi:putative oxidoreductase